MSDGNGGSNRRSEPEVDTEKKMNIDVEEGAQISTRAKKHVTQGCPCIMVMESITFAINYYKLHLL